MARFNIEIGATNSELKKALSESNKLLKQFQKNASNIKVNLGTHSKKSVDTLNASLKQTDALLKSISASASSARNSLRGMGGGVNNTQQVQQEALRLAQLRAETQQYRRDVAQLQAQLAGLRLANAQSGSAATAAAGSYREAQQQLTALGKSIRNAAGGFSNTTPAIRAQITQYRQLQERLKQFDAQMNIHHRNVGNYRGALSGIGRELSSLITMYVSVHGAMNLLTKSFDSALRSDAVQTSLSFILKNGDAASASLRRVQSSAERLGLEYISLSGVYRSFIGAASASNFSLYEAERLFNSVSNAAGKLKLSNDQVQGAFRALEQMISKGNVQAEELRGQLGERIPGAFAIAARAMGVTEQVLNKMLEQGLVRAVDLLPKLATELDKTFGNDSKERIESLQASVNRLTNTFDVAVQKGNISKFFQSIVDGANYALKSINELANSKGWDLVENIAMFTTPALWKQWGKKVNNPIKSRQDAIDAQVSEFSMASPEERQKIWKREKAVYDGMLADYKNGNKSLQSDLIYQGQLVNAIGKQYGEILKSINAANAGNSKATELTKAQLKEIERLRKEREKELERIAELIEKMNRETMMSGLDDRGKEIMETTYKYRDLQKEAKGHAEALKQIKEQEQKDLLAIELKYAAQSPFIANKGVPKQGGYMWDDPGTNNAIHFLRGQPVDAPKVDWSDFTDGLKRASNRFLREFSSGLDSLAKDANYKLGGILAGLGTNLVQSTMPIFQNFFANKLEGLLAKSFDRLSTKFSESTGKAIQNISAGAAMIGSIISQVSKPTSAVGQGIGGALSGAGAGLMLGGPVGAAIGGVIGAISGIIGANRRRKLEEEQLAEQKKQTALMERAQRLAFTSSIIGQQTNQGIITGVDRNAFGDVTFRIQGRDLVATLSKEESANVRGL